MSENISQSALAELYRVMDGLVRYGGIGEISQEAKMLAVEIAENVLGFSDDEVMATALEMDGDDLVHDKRLRHEAIVNGPLRLTYEGYLVNPPGGLKTQEKVIAFARNDLRAQVAGRLFRTTYHPEVDTAVGYKQLRQDPDFIAGGLLTTRMVGEYLNKTAAL